MKRLMLLALMIGLSAACESPYANATQADRPQQVEILWHNDYPFLNMIKVVDTGECFLISWNGGFAKAVCTNPTK